jgi:lysophospholipase
MGGAIAFKYALTHPSDISALILSSAGLVPAVEVPKALDVVARLGSKLFPSVTSSNQIDASLISHDSAYVADYTADPMVHDKISFRWYTEMLATTRECLERAGELAMPLLVFHGTDDKIVDFSGSITTHEKASSKDKTIHLFQGLYHETMNEVEHERTKVLSVVTAWILKHLPAKGKAVKDKAAAKPAKKAPAKKKAAPKKAKPKAKPKK